jgi:serine/threonine-protein kinase
MAALHREGWMHGDIKPSNIFVSPEGHVTLLDLGFARRIDAAEPVAERCVTGTYNYIAPEMVARGLPIDVRSDMYSLGVVLFEMLAGRLPFPGASAAELARQHREVRVPDLSQFAPHLPREACRLVHEILAKEPLRRPQTPAELVDRLLRLEVTTFSMWGHQPSSSSA